MKEAWPLQRKPSLTVAFDTMRALLTGMKITRRWYWIGFKIKIIRRGVLDRI